jgi:Holliday junction resolvasome RuvABC ATP-dependent DNA helicase subunit
LVLDEIVWNYIDPEKLIKDKRNMQKIIENVPEEIKQIKKSMYYSSSTGAHEIVDGSFDTQRVEKKILDGLEKETKLTKKRLIAREYMRVYKLAWNSLDEAEKQILSAFYESKKRKGTRVISLVNDLNYSDSNIYRLKKEALQRFKWFFKLLGCDH